MNVELNAGDGIQIGVAVVLTLTLLAVLWYAWEARKQAKASARIAEETLRPVMVVWTEPRVVGAGWLQHVYAVCYQNVGSGPAVNISFRLSPIEGHWFDPPKRVGMGVREEKSFLQVEFALPIPDELFVVAEYESASHSHWRTTLRLEKQEGILKNRESKVEPVEGSKLS
jgi:hypothetical protein